MANKTATNQEFLKEMLFTSAGPASALALAIRKAQDEFVAQSGRFDLKLPYPEVDFGAPSLEYDPTIDALRFVHTLGMHPVLRPAREVQAPLPAPQPPKSTAIVPAKSDLDPELVEHERLARKLGVPVVPSEIRVARLQAVLAEEGFTCYDEDEVVRYLQRIAAKRSQDDNLGGKQYAWNWFAARPQDRSYRNLDRWMTTNLGVYSEAIPLPVLMTMDRIVERMGANEVGFLVAGLTVRNADPFLAVYATGTETKFIIERWDEPGFRGVKA